MVVPNLLFDALLFGLLAVCALLDSAFPVLHGTASLLIVGALTYWAAQELSESLLRRVGWSQESLATAVALCTGGFIYYWWRNQSDLALLALSIGLMMASLMVAISILTAIGTTVREGKATSVFGWLVTLVAALILGVFAGVLALMLGAPENGTAPVVKLGVVLLSLVAWKLRERTSPPQANPLFHTLESQRSVGAAPALPHTRWALVPQRGTTMDRMMPLLAMGVILLVVAGQGLSGPPSEAAIPANPESQPQ